LINNEEKKITIQDFIEILLHVESNLFLEKEKQFLIKNMINLFKPYKDIEINKLDYILKKANKNIIRKRRILKPNINQDELQKMKLNELKFLIINGKEMTKDDLLTIANISLNIPIGTIQNLKKELIKEKLLNTIDNIEKLDTIKKMAKK
jgi:hypothetical protein